IARQQESDCDSRIGKGRQELFTRNYHCGNRPLHNIGGAATVKFALANGWSERVACPLMQWSGRHDIRVTRKQQRLRAGRIAAPNGPQIMDAKTFRSAVHSLAYKTKRSEPRGDEVQTACIVRSNGRPCDQLF